MVSGAALSLLESVYLPLFLPDVTFRMVGYGMPRVNVLRYFPSPYLDNKIWRLETRISHRWSTAAKSKLIMSITSERYGHLYRIKYTNMNLGRMSYRPCLVVSLGSTTHKAKNIFKTIYLGLIVRDKTTPTKGARLAMFPIFSKAKLVITMVSMVTLSAPTLYSSFSQAHTTL